MRLIADMRDYYANVDNIIQVPDDMDVQKIIDEWRHWYETEYRPGGGRVKYKSWLDWVEERGGIYPKIEEYV